MPRKILVTGGAGFIGSNFTRYMLSTYDDIDVVVLDKLTYAGNLDNLKEIEDSPRYKFIHGDICDEKVVDEAAAGCDCILNFAAETHVDRSIGDPASFITTDVYGTYVLLEATRKLGIPKFIQISTDEVYGDAVEEPSRENSPLMPQSPYAASKAGADRLAYSFFVTYGTPVIITRCSNNYGPNQYPEKMVPLFITNALDDMDLPVYGTGENTRDWIYVTDHVKALDLVMNAGGLEGSVLNVGSGIELSVLQVADRILKALGKPHDLLKRVTDRPGHVRRHAVNTETIASTLGWKAEIDFEKGLEMTVEWYMSNRGWWEKIKSGEFKEYYRKMYAETRKV
ncbi:MAG: dTDP-glucose 4,6-dehydratase [Candidatus Eisenbacteria bacterium]